MQKNWKQEIKALFGHVCSQQRYSQEPGSGSIPSVHWWVWCGTCIWWDIMQPLKTKENSTQATTWMVLAPPPVQCYEPPSIALQALCLPDLITWIYSSPPLYNHKTKQKVAQCVRLFAAPQTVTPSAPLSMEFSKQECQSMFPFPTPGDLLIPGIKTESLASPSSLGKTWCQNETVSLVTRKM